MVIPSLAAQLPALQVGMLSTIPPTACGLATFAEALSSGLRAHGAEVNYVEAGLSSGATRNVIGSLGTGSDNEIAAAAVQLNRCDAVVVQHEYGIFPGADGDSVLRLADSLTVPLIVVAHTVLSHPTTRQHDVLSKLGDAADLVVAMTETGCRRLRDIYGVHERDARMIPHGAAVSIVPRAVKQTTQLLLTWGLLGPGKGIEWAIEAFARIADDVDVDYLVAGATHPNVLRRDGDLYRQSLVEQVTRLGLDGRIVFDDSYRSVAELGALVATSDVVVLPYDSDDQVTSGVLVDAVAAGRPVISTAFPHAVELLASGAGIVVPQRNPEALAAALRSVLTDPDRYGQLETAARSVAPSLSWDAVADSYMDLFAWVLERDTSMAS